MFFIFLLLFLQYILCLKLSYIFTILQNKEAENESDGTRRGVWSRRTGILLAKKRTYLSGLVKTICTSMQISFFC